MKTYDIIGDVHGRGAKLHGLLDVLGWTVGPMGMRRHNDSDRRIIFVGDLIDRGSEHRLVLSTVRAMVDDGTAQVVMGNHEFNAVCFASTDPSTGRPLREHSDQHLKQHQDFLRQLDERERAGWIEWFKTQPLWLDLGDLRVVHACWHNESIEALRSIMEPGQNCLPSDIETWVRAVTNGDDIYEAIEVLLKGPEVELAKYGLPNFRDGGGNVRGEARAAWWRTGATTQAELIDLTAHMTQEDGSPYPELPDSPCDAADLSFAYSDGIPVIYGHHWRQWEPTEHLDWTLRTACVDFSAAKSGPLVAYRWRGESEIDPGQYASFPVEGVVRDR